MQLDHEKLAVYRVSLEFAALAFRLVANLEGVHRHARDQLLRASQSICLNIAEGNGKRSPRDRTRFFEIARGSATESAAALDILVACGACSAADVTDGKRLLHRVVSMLTKMTSDNRGLARESHGAYGECDDNEGDNEGERG